MVPSKLQKELTPIVKDTTINYEEEDSILDLLIKLAPTIKELIPIDCMISITDKEKFLYYLPCREIDLGNIVGKSLPKGGGMYNAINTGKVIDSVLPKEVYGVSFKSRSLPLKDKNGNVIGGIAFGFSLRNQEIVTDVAGVIASSTQQTSATTEELASSAQQLSDNQKNLDVMVKEVVAQVRKTDMILGFINDVSNTSNLLGLSAAIEAARAGDSGKGFSVVAEEIRKLSVKSAQAVKEIRDILATINEKALSMAEKVINTGSLSERQATVTQEISNAMQELATTAGELENIAKLI